MSLVRLIPWFFVLVLLMVALPTVANECQDHTDCDDGVDCTVDLCLADLGQPLECVNRPIHINCDDGVACTVDTCDPIGGCSQTPDDGLCNDGVLCTVDSCDPIGDCSNFPDDTECDDQKGCTDDVCDSTHGCINYDPCPCSGFDFCGGDSCVHGIPLWSILWQSPSGNTESVDQCPSGLDPTVKVYRKAHPIGQTFTPEEDDTYRIDVRFRGREDERKLKASIWTWPKGATPLWETDLSIPGRNGTVPVTLYPDCELAAESQYLLEFEGSVADPPGEFALEYTEHAVYDRGHAVTAGAADTSVDLWFRTFSSPNGTADPVPSFTTQAAFDDPECGVDGGYDCPDAAQISKAELKAIVQDYADLRRDTLHGWTDGEGQFHGNGQAYWGAAYDAFLFTTGDVCPSSDPNPSCLDSVMKMVESATQYRMDNGGFIPFDFVEHIYWAYVWTRDSLDQDQKDAFQRLLLHAGFEYDRLIEIGLNNRNIARRMGFKMITDLILDGRFQALTEDPDNPGQPSSPLFCTVLTDADRTRWIASSDELWGEFKVYYDNDEDSAHYDNLGWRYLLQWIDLYEQDPSRFPPEVIWHSDNTPFVGFVDRSFLRHTPLGPSSVYGDSRGLNHTWATSLLLFLRASNRLVDRAEDPRYESAAFRAFDFQRTRLMNLAADQGVYNEWLIVALAYLELEGRESGSVEDPIVDAVLPDVSEQPEAGQVTTDNKNYRVTSSGGGQAFVATAPELIRIDLKVRNLGSTEPATIQVYEWDAPSGQTTALLYEDELDVSLAASYSVVSAFPFLPVTAGGSYFVKVSRSQALYLAGSKQSAYNGGEAWIKGREQSGDLWFQTFSLSDNGSVLSQRLDVHQIRPSERCPSCVDQADENCYWQNACPVGGCPPKGAHAFGSEIVPAKLFLRSGPNPDDLEVQVNLIGGSYGHGHLETGAILSMTDDGSVLLVGSARPHHLRRYKNGLFAKRHTGGTHVLPDGSDAVVDAAVEIGRFQDYRKATVAGFHWRDRFGWDVDYERRLFFAKNAFLLVRDRAAFGDDVAGPAGQLWHARDVAPVHGPNWYDLFDDVPLGLNNHQFRNYERYVRVFFRPDVANRIDESETNLDENPPSPEFVVSHQCPRQGLEAECRFDTVLVPHGGEDVGEPDDEPTITVLCSAATPADKLALKIEIADTTWTVVDNPGGGTFSCGSEVLLDGEYAIVRTRPGDAPYVMTSNTSSLTVDYGDGQGVDLSWDGVPTSVELNGNFE